MKTKKAMKKITHISMAALVAMGMLGTSCNKAESPEIETPETQKENIVTLTTSVGFAVDGTKALAIDYTAKTLTKTFAEGETMVLRYKNTKDDWVKAVSAPLTAGDITNGGKSATVTFTLTNPDKTKNVDYIYPAAIVNQSGNMNEAALFESQDGTLNTIASTFDYSRKIGAWDGDNLPSLTLENQLAILAITLKNADGSSDITSSITGLTLSDGTKTYNVTREAVAGPIYVAIFPTADATITVTATDGSKNYTKTLTSKTYAKGQFYQQGLKMAEIISLSGRYSSDDELVIADGCILTGYGYNYSCKVSIADGATVTLRDVENNGDIAGCPGIKCLGDATIILEGDNTVTGGDQYAGIYVPGDKTLTIRGTGSLNVTGGSRAAGIGGNATGDANCGSIVISGGTVTATGSFGGAGIGLGANGGECKAITISGGTVEATGGSGGAGIGLGANGEGCKAITISGGTVTAKGDDQAPGIGGATGYYESITITGDVTKVTATRGSGAQYSIGIEDVDSWDYCGPITIGGTVYFEEGNFTNDDLKTSQFVYQP